MRKAFSWVGVVAVLAGSTAWARHDAVQDFSFASDKERANALAGAKK